MGANLKKASLLTLAGLAGILIIAVIVYYFSRQNVAVLEPKGTIGHQERNLILLVLALCAIVVIPVFALTILIALKYREGNKRPKKYRPDWDGDKRLEITWWAIPIAIITVLGVVAWVSAYRLDPFKALAADSSSNKPLTIQAVSLDWKWLFIYPTQNIATVNYVRLPVNTPVTFNITSDSVMNSFWIPNLGGQMYSMPGMSTKLNLMADHTGSFPGSSANISGSGFARMDFTATASSRADFQKWVASVRRSPFKLSLDEYNLLTKPATGPVAYFSSAQPGLYNWVVDKYMMPDMKAPTLIGGAQ